jgi:hypothetical protein
MSVTLDDVPIWIRGGRIIPLYQKAGDSALLTLNTPLRLLIALDEKGKAEGSIYLDDGITFDYEEGVFIERNFSFANKVLKAHKGSHEEKRIPEVLKDTIINEITIYRMNASGSSEVIDVKGLNFRLADEWSWSETEGVPILGSSGREDGHSVVLIVAIVCSVVVTIVVVTVVVMVKRRLGRLLVEGGTTRYT